MRLFDLILAREIDHVYAINSTRFPQRRGSDGGRPMIADAGFAALAKLSRPQTKVVARET